ncbi:hypothetical protein [Euzebya pacifica]|uniref:hypothetical protein n=1 Tax=Euzebya pacifica TaxID=1608957 RepID=UPI000DF83943|nr:hypothetical protein [Euzebya pacifica]
MPSIADLSFVPAGSFPTGGQLRFGTSDGIATRLGHDHSAGVVTVLSAGGLGDPALPLVVLIGPSDPASVHALDPVGVHVVSINRTVDDVPRQMLIGDAGSLATADELDRLDPPDDLTVPPWVWRRDQALRGDAYIGLTADQGSWRLVEHVALDIVGRPIGTVLAEVEEPLEGSVGHDPVGWPGARVDWEAWAAAVGRDDPEAATPADWPILSELVDLPGHLQGHVGVPSGRIAVGDSFVGSNGSPYPFQVLPVRLPAGRWPVWLLDTSEPTMNTDVVIRFGDTRPVCWVSLPNVGVQTAKVGFGDVGTFEQPISDPVPGGGPPHDASGAGQVQVRTGTEGSWPIFIGLDRLGVAVAAAALDTTRMAEAYIADRHPSPADVRMRDRHVADLGDRILELHGDVLAELRRILSALGVDAIADRSTLSWVANDLSFTAYVAHEGDEEPPAIGVDVALPPPHATPEDLDVVVGEPATDSSGWDAPTSQPWRYGTYRPGHLPPLRHEPVRHLSVEFDSDQLSEGRIVEALADLRSGITRIRNV